MEIAGLISFLRALCTLYQRGEGASGRVRVRYSGDESEYLERAPPRQTDILEDGLLDPGFGSGPVCYSDLDSIEVRLSDWVMEKGAVGSTDFLDLKTMLLAQAGVNVRDDLVGWARRHHPEDRRE